MKADGCVKKFHEEVTRLSVEFKDPKEAQTEAGIFICIEILGEVAGLLKARNAKTHGALDGIIREQRFKWVAIVSRLKLPTVEENFFDFALEEAFPEAYQLNKDLQDLRGRLSWRY